MMSSCHYGIQFRSNAHEHVTGRFGRGTRGTLLFLARAAIWPILIRPRHAHVSLGARVGRKTYQRRQHSGLRGGNDQAIVVAFRGSEAPTTLDGLKDWLLTNANNYLILPEGRSGTDFAAAGVGTRFHRGFLDALEMIWQPLFTAVDQARRPKNGHSGSPAIVLGEHWHFWPPGGSSAVFWPCTRSSLSEHR